MLRHAFLILLASAGASLAHPGHDAAVAHGAAHWVSEPSHWVVLALALIVAADLVRRFAPRLAAPVIRRLMRRRAD